MPTSPDKPACPEQNADYERLREAVEQSPSGGLVAYVNRLRADHWPTLYRQQDGEMGVSGCRCGKPICPVSFLLVHIEDLRRSYESKVEDFARETSRSVDHDETVMVSRRDLIDVLRNLPGWVPMGAPGDGAWTAESLAAKDRLLAVMGVTSSDLYL